MKKTIIAKISWLLVIALFVSMIPVNSLQASENKEDIRKMFNYLFIDQPEQQEGDEQTIVVSLGDGAENIQKIELNVKNEEGKVFALQSDENEDGVYLFRETFEKGVYYVDSIMIRKGNSENIYAMEKMDISACFSVGTKCPEKEKSEYIEVESIESAEQTIETTVITMNEETVLTDQNNIAEVLEEAEVKARTVKSRKEIVVVLDPGHDSTHQGAAYYGLKEHILNFKIAEYCKKELETYSGIKVYMTRENEKCPYPDSKSNIDDIKKRVKKAYELGADAYVSIHLNASESSAARGAEVYYYSSNSKGKNISQMVQEELTDLGLYDRKIKSNDSYAVTKTAQSYGFPGIIIEHAFMSNKADSDNWLKKEEGMKKLGIADATGIAKYFSLKKFGTKEEMNEAVYTVISETDESNVLTSTDDKVDLNTHQMSASQRFEIVGAGNMYYYLQSEVSGKAIGVTKEGIVLQEKEEGNPDQKWAFLKKDEKFYYIKSESGKYLSAADGKLVVEDQISDSTHKWIIEKASYRSVEGLVPELISVSCKDESVSIKWKELTGAEGYHIYRKNEQTEWEIVGTVNSGEITSYTDSKAPAGTSCIYTVCAYKGDTKSDYNEQGLSVKIPEKKIYTKYVTTSKVYYRKGPGTTYDKVGLFAKGTAISVENGYSKTANGYTWFRFKQGNSNYYIASKYIKKATALSTPKLVSAKYDNGTVTVKWKKVSGAKGYNVYRKESGKSWGKIAIVKSVNTLQYADKTAVAGKKYTYTVRAYSGDELSGYEKGKNVTIPKETLVKYKTTTKVKYRVGAGTTHTAKGTLAKGKKVEVVKGWSKTANGLKWSKVKMNGKYYYIASKYLKKV